MINFDKKYLLLVVFLSCFVFLGSVSAEDVDNCTLNISDNNSSEYNVALNISDDNGSEGLADADSPKYNGNINNTGQSVHVGPVSNSTNWSQNLAGMVYGSPAIGSDGTLYVGTFFGASKDGYFYALNQNGTVKWRYNTGGITATPAISSNGTIYIGTWTGIFYAFNPDGSIKWQHNLTSPNHYIRGSPAIGADGTIYIGTDNYNRLIAFNPDGSVKWLLKVGNVDSSSPAIGADGTIYIGTISGTLYAVNPNGTVKWSYTSPVEYSSMTFSSPVIGADGTIYIGDNQKYLYALSPNGTLKWSYLSGGYIEGICLSSDGTIYFGVGNCGESALYALTLNGTLKWKHDVDGQVCNCVVGEDGTIYFGSGYTRGDIYALNSNGTLKWHYYLGLETSGVIGAPVIGSDGTLYVGSLNGILYAFKDPNPVVANFSVKTTSNPLIRSFEDESINSPASWYWDFGDGSTSSEENPVHTYARSGTYVVTLLVNNVVSNCTKTINVIVSDITAPIVNCTSHAGYFNTNQSVNLSAIDDSNNVTIYYTLDGSDPTVSISRILYTEQILINRNTVLKFAAVDSSGNWGQVYTQSYMIDTIAPNASVSVRGGYYGVDKFVRISASENGTIYYTLDGSTPTVSSKKYTGPIKVSSSKTLRYVVVDRAGNKSPIYTEKYSIDKVAPKVIRVYHYSKSKIAIKFSENIKSSVNWSKIYIKNVKTGKKISIKNWIKGNKLYIKINRSWFGNTKYVVYIPKSAIKDGLDNKLARNFVFKV